MRACCQLFVRPCRSDHVVVDWSCWKLLPRTTDRIRSPARTRAFLSSAWCLWMRAVYVRRAKRLSKSVIRDCQRRHRLPLQTCRGIRCRSVYVRDSSLCSSFNFLRDYRSCRAAEIVDRWFQAHSSTFEKLSVELQGHVEPAGSTGETIISCSARVLLDPGVQGLLGTEELTGNELASNPQLQWVLRPNFRVSWSCSNSIVALFLSP